MKGEENSTKKYRWRDRKIEKENQKYLQGLVEYDNEGKIIDKPIPPGIKSLTEDNLGLPSQ